MRLRRQASGATVLLACCCSLVLPMYICASCLASLDAPLPGRASAPAAQAQRPAGAAPCGALVTPWPASHEAGGRGMWFDCGALITWAAPQAGGRGGGGGAADGGVRRGAGEEGEEQEQVLGGRTGARRGAGTRRGARGPRPARTRSRGGRTWAAAEVADAGRTSKLLAAGGTDLQAACCGRDPDMAPHHPPLSHPTPLSTPPPPIQTPSLPPPPTRPLSFFKPSPSMGGPAFSPVGPCMRP
jgi:hypothetical protein